MAILSKEAARIIVGKIREDNGGISPEDRAVCPPAILRALDNVRRKLGAATKTLATNLYSKDTRFVYELIQNAEDNNYSQAKKDNEDIFLSFSLYPDRIVLESNEDGFEEKHVKAICSTGESTKTTTQGYIGEKGIGFKSVFKVAKKVHVQSGPFSFSFEYTKGSSDDGLGMVTPLDEEHEQLSTGVRTRITLMLLNLSSFDQRAQDLLDIPDTLLLFLTKLTTLHVNIYPNDGEKTEIKYIHTTSGSNKREAIRKTVKIAGQATEELQEFFVIRNEVKNLPADEARKDIDHASVILAFPIDQREEPIIRQQYAFAFLPLRLAGFTFLIQSDFVTQASREDVLYSTRNEHLLQAVAETFRNAVLHFCSHRKLQYKWIRYLPSDSISDEFWKKLRPKIISLLSNTHCIRSWSEDSLHLPSQLYFLIGAHKDRHDEPLVEDLLFEPKYMSRFYDMNDYLSLKPLGTKIMHLSIFIRMIRVDLSKLDSRVKNASTEEDWHTRLARLLLLCHETFKGIEMLQSLEFIPLQGNKWVSYQSLPEQIFLPTTGKVPIPTDLSLNLVQSAAALNVARKELFLKIGVKNAPSKRIIALIIKKYGAYFLCTVADSISHLRYLYWNLPQDTTSLDKNIFLFNQDYLQVFRNTERIQYIYFEEKNEQYGPWQLFPTSSALDSTIPVLHFLNSRYLDAVPEETRHNGRSWKVWLEELAGVHSYLQIQDPKLDTTSKEFQYILDHKPEIVVGLLKRYWELYEQQLTSTTVCLIGLSLDPRLADVEYPLKETFLPLPRLKSIVDKLNIVDFPFLILPELPTGGIGDGWLFLERFGVTTTDNLQFYVAALDKIQVENYDDDSSFIEALFRIYEAIEQNCSSQDNVAYICELFCENAFIYIPWKTGQDGRWVKSRDCVWTAPEWLEARSRLDQVLDYTKLRHLFHVVLKIPDADWKLYLEDLKTLKKENRGISSRVMEIYRRLWREFEHDSSSESIRESFEDSNLVFLPSENTWNPPSLCIWADDQVQIPRMHPIKTFYVNLEDFFCRILNIQKPNLDMHVQALKELAASRPPPSASKIKQKIMVISSMGPTWDTVKALRRSNIFNVTKTNGQKALTDTTSDFAIVDRSELGSAFDGKIRVLDYTIEEVRTCRPLLLALGLKSKHLSELVEETTTVRDGQVNNQLTRAFRQKAYAIFRCIVHYQDRSESDDKSIYHRLLESSIYISNGIYKSLNILQYGETITVENSPANFHLEDNQDGLGLYIPRDEVAREQCYHQQLPRRLMDHFQILDPAAEAFLSGIISCKFLGAVDRMLKAAGIIEIDGIERPLEEVQSTHQPDIEDVSARETTFSTTASQIPGFSGVTPQSSAGQISLGRNDRSYNRSVPRRSPQPDHQGSEPNRASPSPFRFNSPSPLLSRFGLPSVENAIPCVKCNSSQDYIAILERVINSAARMAIPMRGGKSVDNLDTGLHLKDALFLSTLDKHPTDHNPELGAAGELFIYELLLKLRLTNFSISNWQSKIRREVRLHDKYANMGPNWVEYGASNIKYYDTDSQLTAVLIEHGYLPREAWEDQTPIYHLDVKTTTGGCNEKFYMSNSQYSRMQRMRLNPTPTQTQTETETPPNVYIIFRVFDLKGKIGLRVYVDPEAVRQHGELDFHIETWAVEHFHKFPKKKGKGEGEGEGKKDSLA